MMKRCETCNKIWKYSDKFDAYYCKKCNEWKEVKCIDNHCDICTKRPEKPIQSQTTNLLPKSTNSVGKK